MEKTLLIKIDDIKLCSINKRNTVAKRGNKAFIVKSTEYRKSQDNLFDEIQKYLLTNKVERFLFKEKIHIKLEVWSYKDIDNFVKQTLDVLTASKIISDDRKVLSLYVVKTPRKRGTTDRLNIFVRGEI